jgi:hypothetical protein
MTVKFITAGDGYWSNVSKSVEITDMKLGYVNDENTFGELCVYFDTATWDVNKLGLIYTDTDFLFELNLFLAQHGIPAADYSEQGMQGSNYVSLDVGEAFLTAWALKFGVDSLVV